MGLVYLYRGLSTRTRHPELTLYLDGTEFLVTMGYVRVPRCAPVAGPDWPGPVRPGDVQRIAISLRGTQQRVRRSAAAPTWSPPSPTSCGLR